MKADTGKNSRSPCAAGVHLAYGRKGEEFARRFLTERGYRFLEKNWRSQHLEIDLIFEDCGEIVFVEVKTRASSNFGGAREAVTEVKKSRLLRAAQAWLLAHDYWDRPCRFDVICLTGKGDGFIAEHYINAFDAG